jgi:flagellar hook-length control protein FliK
MPDIAINPLPATAAANGNVAAQNNEAAHDGDTQESFGATLAREIQDQRDAKSAEAPRATDTKKRDPVPEASSSDASVQAIVPPDNPSPAMVPAPPPDQGTSASMSAALKDADSDSSPSSPVTDLIPVMLAMERTGIAPVTQAPSAGPALSTGSPEGNGLRLEAPRLAARSASVQPEPGSNPPSALSTGSPGGNGPRLEAPRLAAISASVQPESGSKQLPATATDPDRTIGMAGYTAPAGMPGAASPRTDGLLSRQDLPHTDKLFSTQVNSNVDAAQQQAAAMPEPFRLIANAPPPSQVSAVITPELGSAGWGKSLGQHISWMVAGEHQTAELHLHPADLGPLQVVLSVENNKAELMFVSREPAVREAIEAAMPQLKQMLSDAGISLGQTSVSANTHKDQPESGNQEQRAMSRNEQRLAGNESEFIPAAGIQARRGMGLVDTFA